MRATVSGAIAIPKASWGCAPALPNRIRVVSLRAMFHMKHCFRETNCVRFGRIASLSACVLFAVGCVVRIAYESFLDFNTISSIPLLRGTACPPLTIPLRRAEPARPQLPAARILQPIIYLLDESKWLPVIQTPMQLTIRQQQLAVRL